LRATGAYLKQVLPDQMLYCYEVHVPLVIHKAAMLEALTVARSLPTRAPHKRTIYGNLAGLGGHEVPDPKVSRQNSNRPAGPWMSSDDTGFRPLVLPILTTLFPNPCRYEDQTS
jgi:hypothetical protein